MCVGRLQKVGGAVLNIPTRHTEKYPNEVRNHPIAVCGRIFQAEGREDAKFLRQR